jgi:hypothetical protein
MPRQIIIIIIIIIMDSLNVSLDSKPVEEHQYKNARKQLAG